MDDHGWGDAGGPAEGRSNAGQNAPGGAPPQETAANVVQFPRDWIGPLEELVPIDTGTSTPEQTDAAVDPPAVDAPGFWDGDISDARSAPAPTWDERAPAETGVPPEPSPGPAVRGSGRLGHATRSEARRPRMRSSARSGLSEPRGPGRGLILSGVALLLLVVAGAVLVSTGGLSRSTREPTSARAGGLVRTLTKTVTTTGVSTRSPLRPRSAGVPASKAKDALSGQRVGGKTADMSSSGATEGTPAGNRTGSVGTGGTSGRGTGDGGPNGVDSGGGAGTGGSVSASAPVAAATSGSSTGAAGSTCAQSPNSGCLP
jgi:hypothetical protein